MKSKSPIQGSVLEALIQLNPDSSKTTLRSWIKEGRIRVNGILIRQADTPIEKGQSIELSAKQKFVEDGGFKIIFEDRYLVAIEKPQGLLSVASNFDTQNTAHRFLKNKYGNVKIVHRLDQGTSGVMVFAREEEAANRLKKTFRDHKLIRRYHALVEGKLSQDGSWEDYLLEDDKYYVHVVSKETEGAEKAITHYKGIKTAKGVTLVEFTLETGRKNQIRVQSAHHGFPLLGDKKYKAKSDPLGRLALHASYLEIPHPYTRKPLKLHSPLPPNFKRVVGV